VGEASPERAIGLSPLRDSAGLPPDFPRTTDPTVTGPAAASRRHDLRRGQQANKLASKYDGGTEVSSCRNREDRYWVGRNVPLCLPEHVPVASTTVFVKLQHGGTITAPLICHLQFTKLVLRRRKRPSFSFQDSFPTAVSLISNMKPAEGTFRCRDELSMSVFSVLPFYLCGSLARLSAPQAG